MLFPHVFSVRSAAARPRWRALGVLLAASAGALVPVRGGEVRLTPAGGITAIAPEQEAFTLHSTLGVYLKDWKEVVPQTRAAVRRNTAENGVYTTSGTLPVAGAAVGFLQTVTLTPDGADLRVEVTPERSVDAEALVMSLALPERDYRGGLATVGDVKATLPPVPPAGRTGHVLAAGRVRELTVTAPENRLEFALEFPRETTVQVQDARQWGAEGFVVFIEMHRGRLTAGKTVSLEARLRFRRARSLRTATVTVDADTVRYPFLGFGGNYCFQIDNHITRFHLRTLNAAVARTEISLRDWEPRNDNADPGVPDRAFFAAQDREGSKLHSELLLGRTLASKGVPIIASIWYLPEWMLEDPGQDKETGRRRLPRENWDEFAESLCAYLEHARERYGWEPAMFSFNEPEAGVKIHFTAKEHTELIKFLGRRFAARGIGTRLLLGDTASARNALVYWPEILKDREALRYVDGISYHTWGGGTPAMYRELAELARASGKPLYIAEAGTDAGAWRTGSFRGSWDYALGEIGLYLDLLTHAAPQATLQWQFSNDYTLSEETPNGAVPTRRYWVMKQFCNWTPRNTRALGVRSSTETVAAAVFGDPGVPRTLHLANLDGAPCRVTVQGLGRRIAARGVVTGREDAYRLLDDLDPRDGVLTLDLPAQSLTTLSFRPED